MGKHTLQEKKTFFVNLNFLKFIYIVLCHAPFTSSHQLPANLHHRARKPPVIIKDLCSSDYC